MRAILLILFGFGFVAALSILSCKPLPVSYETTRTAEAPHQSKLFMFETQDGQICAANLDEGGSLKWLANPVDKQELITQVAEREGGNSLQENSVTSLEKLFWGSAGGAVLLLVASKSGAMGRVENFKKHLIPIGSALLGTVGITGLLAKLEDSKAIARMQAKTEEIDVGMIDMILDRLGESGEPASDGCEKLMSAIFGSDTESVQK